MDYTDINGNPIDIRKKVSQHVKSIKNTNQEKKMKQQTSKFIDEAKAE